VDGGGVVANTLRVGGRSSGAGSSYDNTPWVVTSLDQRRGGADDNEAQGGQLVIGTLREHARPGSNTDHSVMHGAVGPSPDPDGLDSNRYRVVGNGVVAPVAEWIGLRLADYLVQPLERNRWVSLGLGA
jgi:site-specific DNA-cytosine methylase